MTIAVARKKNRPGEARGNGTGGSFALATHDPAPPLHLTIAGSTPAADLAARWATADLTDHLDDTTAAFAQRIGTLRGIDPAAVAAVRLSRSGLWVQLELAETDDGGFDRIVALELDDDGYSIDYRQGAPSNDHGGPGGVLHRTNGPARVHNVGAGQPDQHGWYLGGRETRNPGYAAWALPGEFDGAELALIDAVWRNHAYDETWAAADGRTITRGAYGTHRHYDARGNLHRTGGPTVHDAAGKPLVGSAPLPLAG